jgi:starch synthase (maltosyl-transferring)
MNIRPFSAVIENVRPLVDGGRYPVKRVEGEELVVEADVYKEGHDVLSAVLKWRKLGSADWREVELECIEPFNKDRWRGRCVFETPGAHEFTIEAWGDVWKSWQHEFEAKFRAGERPLTSETLEGAAFVTQAAELALSLGKKADSDWLLWVAREMKAADVYSVNEYAHSAELAKLMWTYGDRSLSTEFVYTLEDTADLFPEGHIAAARYPVVWVDRAAAGFSAWYEFFPRSAEGHADRGSKFRDCVARVEYAEKMGFDVIYFPPIHPIGVTARKGRNNSVTCEPGEPGVPYAIGNRHQDCPNGGGHRDVAPELGTLEDFRWLVAQIKARGMEVALDFAVNCSPDHPYVHDHPEWFYHRPDGSIKYAENPPKKYQDVYPMNYFCPTWREMWSELTGVIEFWCEQGVRIFRVDNPHTKPVHFWEYLIGRVQSRFPDAIFLSEAFTRGKMMRALAKVGFTHSYTYFTWRNTTQGLRDYFNELAHGEGAEYMRPNLWPNTPDILPSYLQFGGRPAFEVRAILATTLAPVYGIYSGFELCENVGLERKQWDAAANVRGFLALCDGDYKQLAREEYLDSEKYQFKGRDWTEPGIRPLIRTLNFIRRANPALQRFRNLNFVRSDNDLILAYAKVAEGNRLLVVVNLDAWNPQESMIEVPLESFGLADGQDYVVEDLLTGERWHWSGRRNYVRLVPGERAGHIFRIV